MKSGQGLVDARAQALQERAARAEGRSFSHDNVGTSDRVVLGNFVIAGEQYLQAVRS